MSSTAQILANRENATHSTGPQTPQGKQTSSQNATRHGLTGSATVLAHESQDDFEQLAATIPEEYEPQRDNETFLVAQMIHARWKLLRTERLEAQAFDMIHTEPGSASDPDARIVTATLRLRDQRTEEKMLDNYIQQVVSAHAACAGNPASQR